MRKLLTIIIAFVSLIASAQHRTYRNDVFDFTKQNWYYAFPGEDFMSKHNLLPGDTVAIKDNVDSIYNINLGYASLHDITFINDSSNTRQVPLGYFVLGGNCYNVKMLGNGSKHVQGNGFKLFDKTHFGLSWTSVGDCEAAYLDFDSCLIGVQFYTKPDVVYPVQYQSLHAHHLHFQNVHNEAMYLGYVHPTTILTKLNIHDITIENNGWDGIQCKNIQGVRINNVHMNGIGLARHYGDQHAILFGNSKDSNIVTNVTVRNCTGVAIFNSGLGDFLFENNDIECEGQSMYCRYTSVDTVNSYIDKVSYQKTVMRCNRFRSAQGVTVQYLTDTSLHKSISLNASGNDCDAVFHYPKDVSVSLTNNSFGATCYDVPVVLPVKLISFTAEKINNAAVLKWIVQDASKVEVERSTDGINFTNLGEGIFNKYVDMQPKGKNFYRLKMYNQDGSFAYSSVYLLSFGNQKMKVVVFNTIGKIVSIEQTEDLEQLKQRLRTSDLKPGFYFLKVEAYAEKFVKP